MTQFEKDIEELEIIYERMSSSLLAELARLFNDMSNKTLELDYCAVIHGDVSYYDKGGMESDQYFPSIFCDLQFSLEQYSRHYFRDISILPTYFEIHKVDGFIPDDETKVKESIKIVCK